MKKLCSLILIAVGLTALAASDDYYEFTLPGELRAQSLEHKFMRDYCQVKHPDIVAMFQGKPYFIAEIKHRSK